jgi:hypothetical protein
VLDLLVAGPSKLLDHIFLALQADAPSIGISGASSLFPSS